MNSPSTEEPTNHVNHPVITKSSTNEDLSADPDIPPIIETEDFEINRTEPSIPKITNEARHSIGSYIITNRERLSRASVSLGIGGGRSNRPSQSENTLAKSQSEIQVCTNSLSVSQNSRNSLMTYSSSGTFYDHSRKKMDVRLHSKPVQATNAKDGTDFRQMEQGLLQLLEDFHCEKLEGFGPNCTIEKMENIREQQETLARLHFDLNSQQEICGQHTEEGIKVANNNLSKLMENLQKLSQSIEQLQSDSPTTEKEK